LGGDISGVFAEKSGYRVVKGGCKSLKAGPLRSKVTPDPSSVLVVCEEKPEKARKIGSFEKESEIMDYNNLTKGFRGGKTGEKEGWSGKSTRVHLGSRSQLQVNSFLGIHERPAKKTKSCHLG